MDKGLTVPHWVADSSADIPPNAPKNFGSICLPKFGFFENKLSLGVRSPRAACPITKLFC